MSSNISQLLQKFQVTLLGEDNFKQDVCDIIFSETKFPLEKKCVKETDGVIRIKTDSYLKMEIMMKKDEILSVIREKYKNKLIKDIV